MMAYTQAIDPDSIAFDDSECHKFSDRYDGYLVKLFDGNWSVQIYDNQEGEFLYPIPPVSDPFQLATLVSEWIAARV